MSKFQSNLTVIEGSLLGFVQGGNAPAPDPNPTTPQLLSTILKTEHDTSKNIIVNIRA